MILWPILARRQERRKKAEREAKRQTKYRAYIDDMHTKIEAERRSQGDILTENVVTLDDCVRRIHGPERSLWERTTGHGDFLGFRLGMGVGDFDAEIKHAPRKFTLDDDDLQDIMLDLAEEPKALPNVPVAMSMLEEPVWASSATASKPMSLARGIVMQLVALHGTTSSSSASSTTRRRRRSWSSRAGCRTRGATTARCASWPPVLTIYTPLGGPGAGAGPPRAVQGRGRPGRAQAALRGVRLGQGPGGQERPHRRGSCGRRRREASTWSRSTTSCTSCRGSAGR